MSTRSTIAIKRKDGTRTAIYCHYDGYIENNGVILQLAYNTADKVEKLLALGDLSSLRYYTNGDDPENVCVAYHRDRGEDFCQSDGVNEFNYTFDEEEACWYVEIERINRDTPGSELLDLGYVLSYPRTLLIDEIINLDFEQIKWRADAFCERADEVIPTCKQKALEARAEIIAEKRAEMEVYYRAYCD